jgi:hypothetical protein
MYFLFDWGPAEAERPCGSLALPARVESAGTNGSVAAERSDTMYFRFDRGALWKLSGRAGARLRQAYGAAGPPPYQLAWCSPPNRAHRWGGGHRLRDIRGLNR